MITRVTVDNVETFLGAPVVFNYGAMYPIQPGKITGWDIIPANKFFDASVYLIAEMECVESGEKKTERVTQFVDMGIGTYLEETYYRVR
jgi:hypothetical protein